MLVVEKRGPEPTRFQTFHLKPEATAFLREHGLDDVLAAQAVDAGGGYMAVPISAYERHHRERIAEPGSGIDVVYGASIGGVTTAADGVAELVRIAAVPPTGSAGPAQAAAGAHEVLARTLTVVAEGAGSSTATGLLGMVRDVTGPAAPMAVSLWQRHADWLSRNGGDNTTARRVLRDDDGSRRTLVNIDHERHGTTTMMELPAGLDADAAREACIVQAVATGMPEDGLVAGPTIFRAEEGLARSAVAAPGRRIVTAGDFNGTTTPNSGSNFGNGLAIDAPAVLDLARTLLQADGTGDPVRAAGAGADALTRYDERVIGGHRDANLAARTRWGNSPTFDPTFGPEVPASPVPTGAPVAH